MVEVEKIYGGEFGWKIINVFKPCMDPLYDKSGDCTFSIIISKILAVTSVYKGTETGYSYTFKVFLMPDHNFWFGYEKEEEAKEEHARLLRMIEDYWDQRGE